VLEQFGALTDAGFSPAGPSPHWLAGLAKSTTPRQSTVPRSDPPAATVIKFLRSRQSWADGRSTGSELEILLNPFLFFSE
jgi:hypothetical protein